MLQNPLNVMGFKRNNVLGFYYYYSKCRGRLIFIYVKHFYVIPSNQNPKGSKHKKRLKHLNNSINKKHKTHIKCLISSNERTKSWQRND